MKFKNFNKKICYNCENFLQRTDICRVCKSETLRGMKPYWELSEYHKNKYGICDKEKNK